MSLIIDALEKSKQGNIVLTPGNQELVEPFEDLDVTGEMENSESSSRFSQWVDNLSQKGWFSGAFLFIVGVILAMLIWTVSSVIVKTWKIESKVQARAVQDIHKPLGQETNGVFMSPVQASAANDLKQKSLE